MNKILLCILDGVGIREESYGNAFQNAKKPNFDYLWNNYPMCFFSTSPLFNNTIVGILIIPYFLAISS